MNAALRSARAVAGALHAPVGIDGRAGRALTAAGAIAAIALVGPTVGVTLGVPAALLLFATWGAAERWPERRDALLVAGGALLALQARPLFAAYELTLLGLLWATRRRALALVSVLVVAAIVVPKELFRRAYHHPATYDWIPAAALAHVAFAALLWWSDRGGRRAPLERWATLFLFPSQPIVPLALAPSDLWRSPAAGAMDVLRSLALVLLKAAALGAARVWGAGALYSSMSVDALARLDPARLWGVVALNYVVWMLTLSAVQDVAVVVARAFGVRLPHPFRLALLAWNPVELWRRWGIYNRKLLLKLVYFPLGGSDRHRYLNVMLTFLASALVLHSGWIGSRYWEIGAGGWRDESVYFALQGLAVCACLAWWQLRGKDPRADRALRWSPSRVVATVATQALSAWLHLIVLPQQVPWAERWRLMVRCLGL